MLSRFLQALLAPFLMPMIIFTGFLIQYDAVQSYFLEFWCVRCDVTSRESAAVLCDVINLETCYKSIDL